MQEESEDVPESPRQRMSFRTAYKKVQEESEDVPESTRQRISSRTAYKNVQEESEKLPKSTLIEMTFRTAAKKVKDEFENRSKMSFRAASKNLQSEDFQKSRKLSNCRKKADPGVYAEHWIVVTSVQKPNNIIHDLANLEGWKLVVVGDLKTPSDWR